MSVYQRKSSGLWIYDFWLFSQRHVSSGFSRRADAEEAQAARKRTLRRRAAGLEAADASDTPRFTDWAAVTFRYQRTRKELKRPDTAKQSLRMILAFWGATPALPVKGGRYLNLRLGDPIARPELIADFEAWMEARAISGARKNHYRSACSMLYRVALLPENRRRAGVRENPFAHVLRNKVHRRTAVLELEDLERWMRSAPLPVAIALSLGLLSPALRLRNVVDLRRTDIARDFSTLTVPHKTDRETGLPLTVAISPGLRRILQEVYARYPKDPFIVPLTGERYWQLFKLVRESVKSAGLPYGRKIPNGITFHSLRHAVATWLAKWRVSPDERQRALAHATPAMTAWYTHLAGIDMAPTMVLLDQKVGVADLVVDRLVKAGERGG